MTTTLKIKYAGVDILENNPEVVNIVYYAEEADTLFGWAYHMDDPVDRNFVQKLMEVLEAASFNDMVDRDVKTA